MKIVNKTKHKTKAFADIKIGECFLDPDTNNILYLKTDCNKAWQFDGKYNDPFEQADKVNPVEVTISYEK